MDKFSKAFIVGSSLPATIWTFTISGISHCKRPCVCYELYTLFIPFILGLINGIVVTLYEGEELQKKLFLFGAIFGLLFSIYGTFFCDFHIQLFGIKKENSYLAILSETLFYSLLFGLIIYNLNIYILNS